MKKNLIGCAVVACGLSVAVNGASAQTAVQMARPTAAPAPQAAQTQAQTQQDIEPNALVRSAYQVGQLIDAGRIGEIWDGASAVGKRAITRQDFVSKITAARNGLGTPQTRFWVTVNRQQLAGTAQAPAGLYATVQTVTIFSTGQRTLEVMTLRLDEDRTWRVAGYSSNTVK